MSASVPATETSILEGRQLADLHEEIRQIYLANRMPWVVGFSGGKDSSTVLQLLWYALRELPREKLNKPIYVISTDTLVETPVIVEHVNRHLGLIGKAAREQGLPIEVHRLTPEVNDTFWVNLIGRGYPAPHTRFRWCTERMKIKPADKFIVNKVAEHGDVILVLGQRRDESRVRAELMDKYAITGSRLSMHSTLPRSYVYTPIGDFTTNEVWTYLLQVPSPWDGDNRQLASLYRSAQSGECPLVVDLSTPSCGNTRFGCWVCTVVSKDRSMGAMIDNGEEWMQPMLDLRDFLADTQDPERKADVRDYKRRDGQIKVRKKQRSLIRGPYTFEFRQEILTRLLQAEEQVRREGPHPDLSLISDEELFEIRHLWRVEQQDWQDSLPHIYRRVTNRELPWPVDDAVTFGLDEQAILAQVCAEEEVPTKLIMALIESQRQQNTLQSRAAVHARIGDIMRSEWRSEEEVLQAVQEFQENVAHLAVSE
ncbi:MAG: DNA phosphorothioation system sulfurtransferase DndC [Ardenticatenaceae bacterium]